MTIEYITIHNISRILRIITGVAIIVEGVLSKDLLSGIAGILVTGMAVFNIGGCCGRAGCSVPAEKVGPEPQDTTYEEV